MTALAGVPSTFPAASIALTRKTCFPAFSFKVFGEVHGAYERRSSLHSKRAPGSEEKRAFTFALAEAVPTSTRLLLHHKGASGRITSRAGGGGDAWPLPPPVHGGAVQDAVSATSETSSMSKRAQEPVEIVLLKQVTSKVRGL